MAKRERDETGGIFGNFATKPQNFITTFWTCLIFGYTAIPVDYISAWNKSWGIKKMSKNVFSKI